MQRMLGEEESRADEAAQQAADELVALQSIFGNDSVQVLPIRQDDVGGMERPRREDVDPSGGSNGNLDAMGMQSPHKGPARLCISVPLDRDGQDEPSLIKVSATLAAGYPLCAIPPQLQLLNRYIGPYGVDHQLFGQVLRVFHQKGSSNDQVLFRPGEVALFDGLEKVREKVEEWYNEREAEALQKRRNDELHQPEADKEEPRQSGKTGRSEDVRAEASQSTVTLVSSPAITDRKSVFVGHAAVLTEVSQVPLVLSELLKDRKIARATHPAIHAWVCKAKDGGVVHRDCDDDGETAAGGRLAHLLDLLHLENVIVVVTRWYGGVHLGADRFKLINRVARDALEVARLVAGPLNTEDAKKGIKR